MNKNNNGRFRIVYTQKLSLSNYVWILQDTETGINYLYNQSGYSGGLTPLLERDGRPVITGTYKEPVE